MKKRSRFKIILLVIFLFFTINICAQLTADTLLNFVAEKKKAWITDEKKIALQVFYNAVNYKPVWLQFGNTGNRSDFFYELKSSADKGLRENDYQYTSIESIRNGTAKFISLADSLNAEIQITDAALHYYNNIAYGNLTPALAYKGIVEMPLCNDVPALLAGYINNKDLPSLSTYLTPSLLEITLLGNKIKWFAKLISEKNFAEVIIISDKSTSANNNLLKKLYQLNFIADTTIALPDSVIIKNIRAAQKQFGLAADGKLAKSTLSAFNISIYERLQALNFSINYYKWLSCFSQNKSVIVINIPAAYLKVYNQQKVRLQMKVIVGKKSTPTPTLLSSVSEVVLYPFWHVPYNIATKEILPKLKRSAAIIDAGNYQVLNRAGNITNPYSVNWKALSTKYFPYTIRQSTGCDNALGLLKINFNSPVGVYLHDTPNKNLFSLNKRFLSHGCMRMENPTALGHLVFKNNSIAIDTLTQKGCLLTQAPIFVKAIDFMPVLVWYNPAGIDAAGNLLFFEDVYGKFKWNKKD